MQLPPLLADTMNATSLVTTQRRYLMDYAEFSQLCETTVTTFLDRVPARYREGFESLLIGGEQRMALTDLFLTLVDDQVPVTPAERENIRRLLEYLKEPTDSLGRLNVVPPGRPENQCPLWTIS